MKSEAAEKDSTKIESRQSIHRRKMSKNPSVVNGADESLSYAAEDESLVRQINLAAAFHDHISCTKSAELCKIDGTRESKVSLPFENDHIYANCGEKKNKCLFVNTPTNPPTTKQLLAQIKHLQHCLYYQKTKTKKLEQDLAQRDNTISTQRLELESLKSCLERRERMCVLRKRSPKPECSESNVSEVKNADIEVNNRTQGTTVTTNATLTVPSAAVKVEQSRSGSNNMKLVTRYIGRGSKNIPSRALKRRILGLPKSLTSKQLTQKCLSSATSFSSESEVHEEDAIPKPEVSKETKPAPAKTSLLDIKKFSKKRCKLPKAVRKKYYITTNEDYLADNQTLSTSPVCSETLIDVPSWKLKPVTSFYQMEGTENINDPVFQRRHLKYEQDERRRKRWDIQRLREQKVSEKLKYKYCRDAEKETENNVQKKPQSFSSDSRHRADIQVREWEDCHLSPTPSPPSQRPLESRTRSKVKRLKKSYVGEQCKKFEYAPANHATKLRLQYIEVTNELPVLAFGHMIPLFQPSDFSLPWKIGESHSSEPTESSSSSSNKMTKKSRLSSTAPKVT